MKKCPYTGVVIDDGREFVPSEPGKPPSFRDVRHTRQVVAARRGLLGPESEAAQPSAEDVLPPTDADMDMDFEK